MDGQQKNDTDKNTQKKTKRTTREKKHIEADSNRQKRTERKQADETNRNREININYRNRLKGTKSDRKKYLFTNDVMPQRGGE